MHEQNKIYVGSDHAGFLMKRSLLDLLGKEFSEFVFEDCGCYDEKPADYPLYAKIVADKVVQTSSCGLLLCGTGAGMAMAANKVKGIRAAQAWDTTSARLSRQHNDANILCLGARLIGLEVGLDVVRIWLKTGFLGARHLKRVEEITKLEDVS